MKNVLLLGDSIRIGYAPIVKEKLSDIANVFYPEDNGRFVHYTYRFIYIWAKDFPCEDIDVVQFNNGLWDVLRMYGDEPFTREDVYVDTLKRIVNSIKKLFPKAKIIFATTTPVDEKNMEFGVYERRNSDIEKYNDLAVNALKYYNDVRINDLYGIAKDFDSDYREDWTHFNIKGYEILADKTVKEIKKLL